MFDRFDTENQGLLSGTQIEQLLLYMNRPVDSVQVNAWLTKLKDSATAITFPDFVSQYSVTYHTYIACQRQLFARLLWAMYSAGAVRRGGPRRIGR